MPRAGKIYIYIYFIYKKHHLEHFVERSWPGRWRRFCPCQPRLSVAAGKVTPATQLPSPPPANISSGFTNIWSPILQIWFVKTTQYNSDARKESPSINTLPGKKMFALFAACEREVKPKQTFNTSWVYIFKLQRCQSCSPTGTEKPNKKSHILTKHTVIIKPHPVNNFEN